MITIPRKRRLSRNQFFVVGLLAWSMLSVGAFVVAGLQQVAYRTQFSQFQSEITRAVEAAPSQIVKAKETGDAKAVAAAMTNFSAELTQKITHAPSRPTVFAIAIGSDSEAKKQTSIVEAAKDMANTLNAATTFMHFQTLVAENLQALSLKDASNYEQTFALADAWKESTKKLTDIPKPVEITDVSDALLQKMSVIESRIRELAELQKRVDVSGFAAKQSELATIIAELKPLGLAVADAATALDTRLEHVFAKLRQNL